MDAVQRVALDELDDDDERIDSADETLQKCERNLLGRTACLYVRSGNLSTTANGECRACLRTANYDHLRDDSPVRPALYLLRCFALVAHDWQPPSSTTAAASATVRRGNTPPVSPAVRARSGSSGAGDRTLVVAAPAASDGLALGVVVAIVVGSVLVLLGALALVMCALSKRGRRVAPPPSALDAVISLEETTTGRDGYDVVPRQSTEDLSSTAGADEYNAALQKAAKAATPYEDFGFVPEFRDKEARAGYNRDRTPEQQAQIDRIRRQQQSQDSAAMESAADSGRDSPQGYSTAAL